MAATVDSIPAFCYAIELKGPITPEMLRTATQNNILFHQTDTTRYAYIVLCDAPVAPLQILRMDEGIIARIVEADAAFRYLIQGLPIRLDRKAPGEVPTRGFTMIRNVPEQPPVIVQK